MHLAKFLLSLCACSKLSSPQAQVFYYKSAFTANDRCHGGGSVSYSLVLCEPENRSVAGLAGDVDTARKGYTKSSEQTGPRSYQCNSPGS